MPMKKSATRDELARVVHWMGDEAERAETAFCQDDYETLLRCLHAIRQYAALLGDGPAAPEEPLC